MDLQPERLRADEKWRGHLAEDTPRRLQEREQLWRSLLTERAAMVVGLLFPAMYERMLFIIITDKEKGIAVASEFASRI